MKYRYFQYLLKLTEEKVKTFVPKKNLHITPPSYINNNMKYRYFQYRLKPTKEQLKNSEFYGSSTRWVWNYRLELNQAAINIQREEINILNWTGTVQIQARGDTSGGGVEYAMAYDASLSRIYES